MVDKGESIATALKREFLEEVFDTDDSALREAKHELGNSLNTLFNNGDVIYEGYVDDRRNTDNAWIETTAVHFHISESEESRYEGVKFKAGSDAKNAKWIDISKQLRLYASHSNFIETIVKRTDALW